MEKEYDKEKWLTICSDWINRNINKLDENQKAELVKIGLFRKLSERYPTEKDKAKVCEHGIRLTIDQIVSGSGAVGKKKVLIEKLSDKLPKSILKKLTLKDLETLANKLS